MSERKDNWTDYDDSILAETVLDYIRNGKTQLNAFEAVGDALNRTAAACGFRWNNELRRKNEEQIEKAKEQYRSTKTKRARVSSMNRSDTSPDQLKYALNRVKSELESLRREINKRVREVEMISQRVDLLMTDDHRIAEDYQALVGIMSRAREILNKTS